MNPLKIQYPSLVRSRVALLVAGSLAAAMYTTCRHKAPPCAQPAVISYESDPVRVWHLEDSADGAQLMVRRSVLYTQNNNDPRGEHAISVARELRAVYSELAQALGNPDTTGRLFYHCKIEDFDGDGLADKLSWPDCKDMPAVTFDKTSKSSLRKSASLALDLEYSLDRYISFQTQNGTAAGTKGAQ